MNANQVIQLMRTSIKAASEIGQEHHLNSEEQSRVGISLFMALSHGLPPVTINDPTQAGSIATSEAPQPTTSGPSNGNGNGSTGNGNGRLTAKQLAAIYAIARSRGFSQAQTKSKVKEVVGKLPEFLTRQEASTAIQALESLPVKDGR